MCTQEGSEDPPADLGTDAAEENRGGRMDAAAVDDLECSPQAAEELSEMHRAVLSGDTTAIRALLLTDTYKDTVEKKTGRTPLHFAALKSNLDAAVALLDAGANKEAQDSEGRTPLYLACKLAARGDPGVALHLIKSGASAFTADSQGATPLQTAVSSGWAAGVRAILSPEGDAQPPTDTIRLSFSSLLHQAVRVGHAEVVAALVDEGWESGGAGRVRWRAGALVSAAAARDELMLEGGRQAVDPALVTPKAALDIPRHGERTGDELSLTCTSVDLTRDAPRRNERSLLSKDGLDRREGRQQEEQYSIFSPLMLAADSGRLDIVKTLLRGRSRGFPNDTDGRGFTALHVAVMRGSACIAEALLQEGGANCDAANDNGDTPLHVAVASRRINVGEVLLRAGASVHLVNRRGHTALHFAAAVGLAAFTKELLSRGADVDAIDGEGAWACQKHELAAATFVADSGVGTARAYSCRNVRDILTTGRETSEKSLTGDCGDGGMLEETRKRTIDSLENCQDPTEKRLQRRGTGHCRKASPEPKIVPRKQGNVPSPGAESSMSSSLSPERKQRRRTLLLRRNSSASGSISRSSRRRGDVPLGSHEQKRGTKMRDKLGERMQTRGRDGGGGRPSMSTQKRIPEAHGRRQGVTPLDNSSGSRPRRIGSAAVSVACLADCRSISNLEISLKESRGAKAGGDADDREEGVSALQAPIAGPGSGGDTDGHGHTKEKGGDNGGADECQDGNAAIVQRSTLMRRLGRTPLHYAALNGRLAAAQVLLEAGARAKHNLNEKGESPLFAAARGGHAEVVGLLLEQLELRDVDARSSAGDTPLSVAVENGHPDVMEKLIKKGASIHQRHPFSNQSLLGKAVVAYTSLQDRVRIVRSLLQAGADPNGAQKQGAGPDHPPIGNHPAFLETNASSQTSRTKHHPLPEHDEELMREKGDMVEPEKYAGSFEYFPPLHNACRMAGGVKLVEVLLNAGADADATAGKDDGAGVSALGCHGVASASLRPLHVAAAHGNSAAVCALTMKGCKLDVETMDPSRSTPLALAVQGGHLEAARALIEAGASIRKVPRRGDGSLLAPSLARLAAAMNRGDIVSLLAGELVRRDSAESWTREWAGRRGYGWGGGGSATGNGSMGREKSTTREGRSGSRAIGAYGIDCQFAFGKCLDMN